MENRHRHCGMACAVAVFVFLAVSDVQGFAFSTLQLRALPGGPPPTSKQRAQQQQQERRRHEDQHQDGLAWGSRSTSPARDVFVGNKKCFPLANRSALESRRRRTALRYEPKMHIFPGSLRPHSRSRVYPRVCSCLMVGSDTSLGKSNLPNAVCSKLRGACCEELLHYAALSCVRGVDRQLTPPPVLPAVVEKPTTVYDSVESCDGFSRSRGVKLAP